jgi:hypothetical protein
MKQVILMREPSDYGAGVTYYAGIMGYQSHETYVWFGQAPVPTDGSTFGDNSKKEYIHNDDTWLRDTRDGGMARKP